MLLTSDICVYVVGLHTVVTGRVIFFGMYSGLVKVLGQFSIIYFRGLWLRIGVRVWVRVGVRV